MFAEFIYRPISGKFEEKSFGEIHNEPSWVKFTKDNFEEWVASFERSSEFFETNILNFLNKQISFVICGGIGYLVDVENEKLINDITISGIYSAKINNEGNDIFFSDGLNLKKINGYGEIEVILSDYFFDEIKIIEIKNNKLFAEYWYYQKSSETFYFEYDLITKEKKDTYYNTE